MYIIPKAKSGVYFTHALNETNYNQGLWLLGYYWRASKISKPPYYPITNFDGMVSFLKDRYPTFIESLGNQLKDIPSDKMIAAMNDAASKGYTDYPRPAYFNNSIIDIAPKTAVEVLSESASEIAGDISRYARYGLYGVIAVGLAYAGVMMYSASGKKIDFGKLFGKLGVA